MSLDGASFHGASFDGASGPGTTRTGSVFVYKDDMLFSLPNYPPRPTTAFFRTILLKLAGKAHNGKKTELQFPFCFLPYERQRR